MSKCQNATICGPFDAIIISPELKVSEPENMDVNDLEATDIVCILFRCVNNILLYI